MNEISSCRRRASCASADVEKHVSALALIGLNAGKNSHVMSSDALLRFVTSDLVARFARCDHTSVLYSALQHSSNDLTIFYGSLSIAESEGPSLVSMGHERQRTKFLSTECSTPSPFRSHSCHGSCRKILSRCATKLFLPVCSVTVAMVC